MQSLDQNCMEKEYELGQTFRLIENKSKRRNQKGKTQKHVKVKKENSHSGTRKLEKLKMRQIEHEL